MKNNQNKIIDKFFLNPQGVNSETLKTNLNMIFDNFINWRKDLYPKDKINFRKDDNWNNKLSSELKNLLSLLNKNFPFYHPRYMAHMLSETIIPGILGYFAGMLFNPNNVTEEAAPVTVNLEIEFTKKLCQMLGYKSENNKSYGFAHICSGGSIANLESLWVAREVQYIPLIIKEFCEQNNITDFLINIPNIIDKTKGENIINISNRILLSLKPDEKISLPNKMLQYLIKSKKMNSKEAIEKLNKHIKLSKYSVRWNGLINVIQEIKLKPIIFIPESAHYSWDKTASLLGFGNSSIRRIPITSKFRINVKKLKEMIYNLSYDEFIVAVITVVGTTEEGAIDPVHEVVKLREEFEKDKNMSFWIHIDSAWGGFIRSLFNIDDYQDLLNKNFENKKMEDEFINKKNKIMEKYKQKNKEFTKIDEDALKLIVLMDIREIYKDNIGFYHKNYSSTDIVIEWNDINVIKSFISFKDADSITIDPHKLGYIQYPAGVIAFKNATAVQFIAQKASYIGMEKITMDEMNTIESIGSYIIEGSKPGAAAVACWLLEKTIPFNIKNHGEIIKRTLLNSKRYYQFILKLNSENFIYNFKIANRNIKYPYKIIPLYENIDSNLVCFFILPMKWTSLDKKDVAMFEKTDLAKMNIFNEKIYKHFTIINDKDNYISSKERNFYISRTRLTAEQYSSESIAKLLENNKINKIEYEKEGLFVLRATLMNPWEYDKESCEVDYYYEFFKELNEIIIQEISKY